MVSNPQDVSNISKVIFDEISLVDSLETIDHVYTITSLSGFEALIRGDSGYNNWSTFLFKLGINR